MSGKKRRWPAETNLAALKTLAHTLLWFDIQPTKLSPLVVKHPFTDSGLVGIRNEDGSLSAVGLLEIGGAVFVRAGRGPVSLVCVDQHRIPQR